MKVPNTTKKLPYLQNSGTFRAATDLGCSGGYQMITRLLWFYRWRGAENQILGSCPSVCTGGKITSGKSDFREQMFLL